MGVCIFRLLYHPQGHNYYQPESHQQVHNDVILVVHWWLQQIKTYHKPVLQEIFGLLRIVNLLN